MSVPVPIRIAAVDFGTVRIGVAVADLSVRIATPLANYTRRGREADAAWFSRLAGEERIARFIVGLPVHLDGRESAKSQEARAFGAWLGETTGVEVEYFDERFTSHEAEQHLVAAGLTRQQRRKRLDKLAAQILLTAYLEAGASGDEAPKGLESA